MSEFTKEDRYLVIKRSDIKSALDGEMQSALQHIAQTVEAERSSLGKPVLECVVVESDWPIYEHVWNMVEAITANYPTELDQLRKDNTELVSVFKEILGNVEEMTAYSEDGGYVVNALSEADVDVINETLNNLSIPSCADWSGEGLPPIGVECEMKHIHSSNVDVQDDNGNVKNYRRVVTCDGCDANEVVPIS